MNGPKRGIILLILFFLPELSPFIEPLTKAPAKFFRRIFWESMNNREKVRSKRGDLIDSLLALKNGEQISNFSESIFFKVVLIRPSSILG